MVSAPARDPTAEGVNVTLIEQLAPAATVAPQLLVWAKSPVTETPDMLSGASPVFRSVTACAGLGVPTNWRPKVRLDGEKPAPGPSPAPDSATDCGFPW